MGTSAVIPARNASATIGACLTAFEGVERIVVRPGVVERIVSAVNYDSGYAAVFETYDAAPAATNFCSRFKNLFHHFVHQHASAEASTFWAGCGAVRRDVFDAVIGFDESYTLPSIEDIELGYRMRRAGHRILLDKSLLAAHLKQWTALTLVRDDFFRRALPWSDLCFRSRGFIDDLNIRWTARISALLVLLPLLYGLAAGLLTAFGELFAAAGIGGAVVALGCVAGLMWINGSLYRFFGRMGGPAFLIGAAVWHWFYLLYGSVAFGVAALRRASLNVWSALSPGRSRAVMR